MYTAPDSIITDTIYSVANSVDGDGNPQPGDEWNFGENFPVTIIENPVSVDEEIILNDFELSQNYPNPFSAGGGAGTYEVDFNASGLSNGIYFYRLEASGFTAVKKMILLR